MEVQPQLVLLQKTLLNIEGLGRQLYPDLDLWETAKPFLERNMSEQIGARSLIRHLQDSVPSLSDTLPALPTLVHRYLDQATTGNLRVEWTSQDLKRLQREVRNANRRTAGTVVGTGLLIAAAVIYGLDGYSPRMFLGAPLLSWLALFDGLFLIFLNWPDEHNRS